MGIAMPLVQPEIYQAVVEALAGCEPAALCTVVNSEGSVPGKRGAKMLVYADGRQLGTVGGAGLEEQVKALALEAIRTGQGATAWFDLSKWVPGGLNSICGGRVEVYVEVLSPPPHLLLAGGGHVAQAVAKLATVLGYRYSVLDDRTAFVDPTLFPGAARLIHGIPEELFDGDRAFDLTPYSDIYVMGYSWEVDTRLLARILPRFEGFVGLIGSRTKCETTRRELSNAGVPEEDIAKLTCPIGLMIGAESPAEI
ncbi:MAG TPA: XdhC/CoxI family protein, partial [bacterium]|nr:XdhC/CoxI family protein [bacterium]